MQRLIVVRSGVFDAATGALTEAGHQQIAALAEPLAAHAGDDVFILASPAKSVVRATLLLNERVGAQGVNFEPDLGPDSSGYRGIEQLLNRYGHLAPVTVIVSEHGIRLAAYLAKELWRRSFELGPELEPGSAVIITAGDPVIRIP